MLGRTASTAGSFVFYRKYIAFILLVLYGVPAAIGPHWHSHHSCTDGLDCASTCHDTHSHSDHSSLSIGHAHECQFHSSHGSADSDTPTLKTLSLGEQLVVSGLADDCSSCLICHFYSCTPFIGLAISLQPLSSLVESLVVARPEPLPTLHQLHFARGPPAASINA